MNIPEDRLISILSNVAKNINLKKWKYICQENMKTIDNYFGILVPATISGTKNTDITEDITLHLLMKFAPNIKDERMKLVIKYLYQTEAFFYTILHPMLSSAVRIDHLIPNCYYVDLDPDNQVIVLQDMTFEGYRRYTNQFLDFDHLAVALKGLAEFHALSVILLEKGEVPDNDGLLAPYTDTHPVELNISLKLALNNHHKYFKGTKYEKYLKGLISRYSSVRLDSFQKARRLVHGHGDYWKENIIFKYKDNKPDQACIIDFQTLRFLSPSQDFLNFIIVGTDMKTKLKHYDELLSIYLEAISKILSQKNKKLANSYIEDFKHDLKIVAENCLVMSFMGLALWYGLEEETLVKSKKKINKNSAVQQFIETIANIIDDLEKLGYITL